MPPPTVIVALLIGELPYQPRLNAITSRIVEHAAAAWKRHPEAVVVCEAEPMRRLAADIGVPDDQLVTALPQPAGHTTRKLIDWLLQHRDRLPAGCWWLMTHDLHAPRAARMFARGGIDAVPVPVSAPFDAGDADWKLRSAAHFRAYDRGALLYCRLRGWV